MGNVYSKQPVSISLPDIRILPISVCTLDMMSGTITYLGIRGTQNSQFRAMQLVSLLFALWTGQPSTLDPDTSAIGQATQTSVLLEVGRYGSTIDAPQQGAPRGKTHGSDCDGVRTT